MITIDKIKQLLETLLTNIEEYKVHCSSGGVWFSYKNHSFNIIFTIIDDTLYMEGFVYENRSMVGRIKGPKCKDKILVLEIKTLIEKVNIACNNYANNLLESVILDNTEESL